LTGPHRAIIVDLDNDSTIQENLMENGSLTTNGEVKMPSSSITVNCNPLRD